MFLRKAPHSLIRHTRMNGIGAIQTFINLDVAIFIHIHRNTFGPTNFAATIE